MVVKWSRSDLGILVWSMSDHWFKPEVTIGQPEVTIGQPEVSTSGTSERNTTVMMVLQYSYILTALYRQRNNARCTLEAVQESTDSWRTPFYSDGRAQRGPFFPLSLSLFTWPAGGRSRDGT